MPRNRGFSLVELLVVISIMAVLAGLIVAVIPLVQRAAKRNRTEAILEAVRLGLSMSGVQSGTVAAPAPHPMAGSAAPRSLFIRGETITGKAGTVATAGDLVSDLTNEAILAPDPTSIAPMATLLLPSDRYQGGAASTDCDLPLIYGVARRHLGIPGSGAGLVRYRRIAVSPATDGDGDGVADVPYDRTRYRDPLFLIAAPGDLNDEESLEVASKRALDAALGGEQAATELSKLGALKRSDRASGALIANKRLRLSDDPKNSPRVRDADGTWKPYRLRGTAIYDAWGREILYWLSDSGQAIFESAGADGVFRWHAGNDGALQTAAAADGSAGDDRDGQRDNVVSGAK